VNQVLFDNELLSKKQIINSLGRLVTMPEEAEPTSLGFVYCTDLVTRLEVKYAQCTRIKIRFYDLRSEEMLFGFQNVMAVPFYSNGLLVLEKCLGSFGKTVIDAESISFNDLNFELTYLDLHKNSHISKVLFREKELFFKKDDLICTSMLAYFL